MVAANKGIDFGSELEMLKLDKSLILSCMLFNSMDKSDKAEFANQEKLQPMDVPCHEKIWEFLSQKFINSDDGPTKKTVSKVNSVKGSDADEKVSSASGTKKKFEVKKKSGFKGFKARDQNKPKNSDRATGGGFECYICSKPNHSAKKCHMLIYENDVTKRAELVKQKNLCSVCLRKKGTCKCDSSTQGCYHCKGNHHTLLHMGASKFASLTAKLPQVIRPTALVSLKVGKEMHEVKALIDPGANLPVVTYQFAQRYKLKMTEDEIPVTNFNGDEEILEHSTEFVITPHGKHPNHDEFHFLVRAGVAKKLDQEEDCTPVSNLPEIMEFTEGGSLLADPQFTSDRPIDLVLEVFEYAQILKSEVKRFKNCWLFVYGEGVRRGNFKNCQKE